jgi:hypothetical protein
MNLNLSMSTQWHVLGNLVSQLGQMNWELKIWNESRRSNTKFLALMSGFIHKLEGMNCQPKDLLFNKGKLYLIAINWIQLEVRVSNCVINSLPSCLLGSFHRFTVDLVRNFVHSFCKFKNVSSVSVLIGHNKQVSYYLTWRIYSNYHIC